MREFATSLILSLPDYITVATFTVIGLLPPFLMALAWKNDPFEAKVFCALTSVGSASFLTVLAWALSVPDFMLGVLLSSIVWVGGSLADIARKEVK